jgi:hypothetical protein
MTPVLAHIYSKEISSFIGSQYDMLSFTIILAMLPLNDMLSSASILVILFLGISFFLSSWNCARDLLVMQFSYVVSLKVD